MKGDILYLLALWLLGYAVNKMVEDAEAKALRTVDEHERIAWSSGFERGVKSVEQYDIKT